ncbi:MAG TPA: GNAT family N-acetyltransferase [Flavisolibacter sp.]|nr:GNAT family N-acetyltransferase [Flavisolibacter sp.]
MERILVRKAHACDLNDLRRFEQGVIEAERPFDPTLKPGQILYYDLENMIDNPLVALLVAEVQGRLIASGYARIQPAAKPYLVYEAYAYLGFMYVLPEFRGRGVNAMILQALKNWVAEQGFSEMRLEVYAANEPAIRAYEKYGFARHMIEMRMPVDKSYKEEGKEGMGLL